MNERWTCGWWALALGLAGLFALSEAGARPPRPRLDRAAQPRIVGHRGLMLDAPENTLAGFAACIDLRLGLELDVRRSKDGHLVVVHDASVTRTTDGKGVVAELTLAQLKKLDAGKWFAPDFAGQRVPTLDEVFALLASRKAPNVLVALDLKIDDGHVEADVVRLANKHGVLGQVLFIGTTIDSPAVRRRIKNADKKAPVAVLAQTAADLPRALADEYSDWAYVRFVPTAEQVTQAHRAGKRVFLVGKTVAGREQANWRRARAAGVDALLTDYPLECRRAWSAKAP